MLSDEELGRLCRLVSKCFHIEVCGGNYAVVTPLPGWLECFDSLVDEIEEDGFQAKLVSRGNTLILVFFRLRREWSPFTPILALLVTLVTVLLAGFDVARAYSALTGYGSIPLLAFSFVAGLLGPLAVHETGHYAAAKRRRIPVSPPIFIPAPPPSLGGIGTFGAFINMRGLARDRESLALLGLMGPLLGFLIALPVAWLGVRYSAVMPLSEGVAGGVGFAPLVLLLFADSIGAPRDSVIVLHPLALAAFIVFTVTFLNLLPVGQLDGAHIVYAVFGERAHRLLNNLVPVASMILALLYPSLAVVALFSLMAYILNAVLARGVHPGVLNPYKPVKPWLASIIVACYVILLILTLPVPLA